MGTAADFGIRVIGSALASSESEVFGLTMRYASLARLDNAIAQWKHCLPFVNHENRQCGLRAAKAVMKEGGVIASDHVRHPLKPLGERTKARLLELAGEMDLVAMSWGK